MPVSGTTDSPVPPTAVTTCGTPHAIASSGPIGNASQFEREHVDVEPVEVARGRRHERVVPLDVEAESRGLLRGARRAAALRRRPRAAPRGPLRKTSGIASSSTSMRFARRSVDTAPTTRPDPVRWRARPPAPAGSRCGRPQVASCSPLLARQVALELADADRRVGERVQRSFHRPRRTSAARSDISPTNGNPCGVYTLGSRRSFAATRPITPDLAECEWTRSNAVKRADEPSERPRVLVRMRVVAPERQHPHGQLVGVLELRGREQHRLVPVRGQPAHEMEDVLGDAAVGWLADDRYAGHDGESKEGQSLCRNGVRKRCGRRSAKPSRSWCRRSAPGRGGCPPRR